MFSGGPVTAPAPRLRAAHWRAAVAVLDAIWREQRVADATLQAWYREHREMGGRDRAQLGGMVYGVLRDAMRLAQIAGPDAETADVLAIHLLDRGGIAPDDLRAVAGACADRAVQGLEVFDEASLTPAARHNVPAELWRAWTAQYGDAAADLAQALNREAPVDLRVNVLKTSREEAHAALLAAGVESEPTRYAPQGLRLSRRVALQNLRIWRDGAVEPQDEGSQLLAALVGAQPGERIVDYCAGAGGKTLALAAALGGRGELWALDVSASRLARIGPRAQRAGVTGLRTEVLPARAWHDRHAQRCDAVLVDAPCSGTGTWRRNPDLRLRCVDAVALAAQQGRILDAAAELVRPGGRLVYGTCSVLAAENEEVIDGFLARHPAFGIDAADVRLGLPELAQKDGCMRLLPHIHNTDGFFAARLVRK